MDPEPCRICGAEGHALAHSGPLLGLREDPRTVGAPYVADRTLYLDADKAHVLEEGDPDAAFLLVRAGASIPESEAARYGLVAGPVEPDDKEIRLGDVENAEQGKPADAARRKKNEG